MLNRSSTKGITIKTPHEKWNGRKLNVSHLKVFGSIAFVKTTGRLSKLKDKSKCIVFMMQDWVRNRSHTVILGVN